MTDLVAPELRGWIRISELMRASGRSRPTILRLIHRLNRERVKRGARPLTRRVGPHGGVIEVHVPTLRHELRETPERLGERSEASSWTLRRLETGQRLLRRGLDDVTARVDRLEAVVGARRATR